jgi:hypothetical protein
LVRKGDSAGERVFLVQRAEPTRRLAGTGFTPLIP